MAFIACPLCKKRYPSSFINAHAANCSPPARRAIRKPKSLAPRPRDPEKTSKTRLKLQPKFSLSSSPSSPPSASSVPGFHVFPQAFADLDSQLFSFASAAPPQWTDYRFRLAKNYGPPYDLRRRRFLFDRDAPPSHGLPHYAANPVLPRLRALLPLLRDFVPNQLSVGMYRVPGESHILPHNDCENAHVCTAVVGVCLGGACTMTLILRKADSGVGHDVKRDIFLSAGCAYVMSGDSLRLWHHAIFPKKTLASRISLTFRDIEPHSA